MSTDSAEQSQSIRIDGQGGVCFVEQILVLPDGFEESILTMTAAIKTTDLQGRGAGLNLGIYNADSMLIQNADMGYADYNYAQGSQSWSEYEISVVVPDYAASARLGVISFGEGEAKFDSIAATFESLKGRRPGDYAKDYVASAIGLARENSLRRDSVDFDRIESTALQLAGNAEDGDDMYLATRYILGELRDHHSFLMTASDRQRWLNEDDDDSSDIAYTKASKMKDYGYLWVPGFHGNGDKTKTAFATRLQEQIDSLSKQSVSGWIVDLRENDGGNMAPMLAGLEPLFAVDTLGYLVDVNDAQEAWGRGEEIRLSDEENYVSVNDPVTLASQLPVAVLYDESTGSSGEIVIISFIGRPSTRSFGVPSMGLTTGNGEFELPDGSYMFMASTKMADRSGQVFEGAVAPDQIVDGNPEDVVAAAITWLNKVTQ